MSQLTAEQNIKINADDTELINRQVFVRKVISSHHDRSGVEISPNRFILLTFIVSFSLLCKKWSITGKSDVYSVQIINCRINTFSQYLRNVLVQQTHFSVNLSYGILFQSLRRSEGKIVSTFCCFQNVSLIFYYINIGRFFYVFLYVFIFLLNIQFCKTFQFRVYGRVQKEFVAVTQRFCTLLPDIISRVVRHVIRVTILLKRTFKEVNFPALKHLPASWCMDMLQRHATQFSRSFSEQLQLECLLLFAVLLRPDL